MRHEAFFMRRVLALATLLLVSLLAGCGGQTDPATNVTATSATLNGQESCKAGESGTRWWRYRLGIKPWQETTHANWSCSRDQSQSISTTITGLTPGSHYQYEICGTLASYPPVCANADGAADNAIHSHERMMRSTPRTRPRPRAPPQPAHWTRRGSRICPTQTSTAPCSVTTRQATRRPGTSGASQRVVCPVGSVTRRAAETQARWRPAPRRATPPTGR